jgi:hypothetical protein
MPFESTFTGGVLVTAADIDGDGMSEIVVTPDQGGGPVVAVYSGARLSAGLTGDAAQLGRFLGIEDGNFRGGARAALGDVNGDSTPDLIVAAGYMGGPRIAVFNGQDVITSTSSPKRLVGDFFAFEQQLRDGAFVAVGDLDGDGFAELMFGAGSGGAPRIRAVSGRGLMEAGTFSNIDELSSGIQLVNYLAGDASTRGGVRPSIRDIDGDGRADLITGSGERQRSEVRVYNADRVINNPAPTADHVLDPFGGILPNGIFVG